VFNVRPPLKIALCVGNPFTEQLKHTCHEHEEKRARNRAALKRHRDRKKEEKEEMERKMEELRKENQEIELRNAVHQQELSFLRQVVSVHVQENGTGILDAEPVLKNFLEEDKDEDKDQNCG